MTATCRSSLTILAFTLVSTIGLLAQHSNRALGTIEAGFPISNGTSQPAGPSAAFVSFAGASYGTGGVALRNRGGGTIHVSGVTGSAQAAFIYWGVLSAVDVDATIGLQREFPTLSGVALLRGTLIATGADPCWGSSGISIYRAAVPTGVANGNGAYKVILRGGASGLTDGEDPWDGNVVFPLMEGASMVIVGTGNGTVGIYDAGLAGNTFNSSLNYSLTLPAAASGTLTLWDNIGADGQGGASRTSHPTRADLETVSINGVQVSGVGGLNNDSDWNGSSGLPLPQLWDDTGHDITVAAPAGTTTLNISVTSNGDCLTPVANVVEVQ